LLNQNICRKKICQKTSARSIESDKLNSSVISFAEQQNNNFALNDNLRSDTKPNIKKCIASRLSISKLTNVFTSPLTLVFNSPQGVASGLL
jgi:hypothetical protein